MPNPAQSGLAGRIPVAGESISDVVPTRIIAARPIPARPVSLATSRPVMSMTATRIE